MTDDNFDNNKYIPSLSSDKVSPDAAGIGGNRRQIAVRQMASTIEQIRNVVISEAEGFSYLVLPEKKDGDTIIASATVFEQVIKVSKENQNRIIRAANELKLIPKGNVLSLDIVLSEVSMVENARYKDNYGNLLTNIIVPNATLLTAKFVIDDTTVEHIIEAQRNTEDRIENVFFTSEIEQKKSLFGNVPNLQEINEAYDKANKDNYPKLWYAMLPVLLDLQTRLE